MVKAGDVPCTTVLWLRLEMSREPPANQKKKVYERPAMALAIKYFKTGLKMAASGAAEISGLSKILDHGQTCLLYTSRCV